jgi:hypothetical protein
MGIGIFIRTSLAARIAAYLVNGSQQCAGKLKDSYRGVQSGAPLTESILNNCTHCLNIHKLLSHERKTPRPGVLAAKKRNF